MNFKDKEFLHDALESALNKKKSNMYERMKTLYLERMKVIRKKEEKHKYKQA